MSYRQTRRLLAVLALPACVAVAGTAGTTLARDDEHHASAPAHGAAPAPMASGHDDHATGTPAKSEHVQPTTKAEPTPPNTKAESKPASMSMGEPNMGESKQQARPASKMKLTEKVVEPMDTPMTADAALKLLQEGNQRWVSDKDENPNTDPSRRAMLAEKGQKPFVTILTCADSRLPVERIFDRGVGEVFVVRVAGNVAGTSETGTIEYAVEHIKTPLLVVMGHTKCGAVAAAVSGAPLPGALGELVSYITPAVDRAKRNNPETDDKMIAPLAVKENVWQSITDLLKRSPEIRGAASKGEIRVVGAVCDIATGKVEWMGEHPWQSELIEAFNTRSNRNTPATAAAENHDEK